MHPVPKSELPHGAVCGLAPAGRLSAADRWHIERLGTFLADKKEIDERYAAQLDARAPEDPRRGVLAQQRKQEVRALYQAYDAECEHVNETGVEP